MTDQEKIEPAKRARRLSAFEAFWDHLAPPPIRPNGERGASEALDEAIEVAVRVKITPELIEAWQRGANIDGLPNRTADGLRAAFEAAGFEVEQ